MYSKKKKKKKNDTLFSIKLSANSCHEKVMYYIYFRTTKFTFLVLFILLLQCKYFNVVVVRLSLDF